MKPFILLVLISCAALAQVDLQPRTLVNWPTTYTKLSTLLPPAHATSGCNAATGLRTGGSACYDDSSYLNTFLATASATNPIWLYWDIPIGFTVPAAIKPYTKISGPGSDTFVGFALTASDTTGICSYALAVVPLCNGEYNWSGSPPTQAGGVEIDGIALNMNRGSYPNSNSTTSDLRCVPGWCNGIYLSGYVSIVLNDIYIYDSPTYGVLMDNFGYAYLHNIRVGQPNHGTNTDGIHMGGPFGYFYIDGAQLQCGDDGITNNLPEGGAGNGGGGFIANVNFQGCLSGYRNYTYNGSGTKWTMGPVVMTNLSGYLSDYNGVDTPTLLRLGYNNAGNADATQSIKVSNSTISITHNVSDGALVTVQDNVGEIEFDNVTWLAPVAAKPWITFAGPSNATVSNFVCTACTIYRNTTGNAAAFWGIVPNSQTIQRVELNGAAVLNEQGESYSALSYAWDVQSGGAIGTFDLTSMDPHLMPTLLNGNEWSRITIFYGAGVPNYFRNTTYANLPPATYTGLAASISDSAAGGTWGATESGGSAGHYAQLTSDGTNWTVTGK